MTPIHLRAEYWGIEVPADAINFEITRPFNDRFHLNWGYPDPLVSSGMVLYYKDFGGKKSYPQQIEIVCLRKEVTEEVAKEIMWVIRSYEPVHGLGSMVIHDMIDTYVKSLHSFLRSKGLNPQSTLILKKTA